LFIGSALVIVGACVGFLQSAFVPCKPACNAQNTDEISSATCEISRGQGSDETEEEISWRASQVSTTSMQSSRY